MKTTMIIASVAVSAMLDAPSVCADPISSSSKSQASSSLRDGLTTPSAVAEDRGLFRPGRDLQLAPENLMECYTHPAQTNDQYVDEIQRVDCSAALLNSCGSLFGCVPSYGMATAAGSSQCATWAQWPAQ
jgi:hypothetical protein